MNQYPYITETQIERLMAAYSLMHVADEVRVDNRPQLELKVMPYFPDAETIRQVVYNPNVDFTIKED